MQRTKLMLAVGLVCAPTLGQEVVVLDVLPNGEPPSAGAHGPSSANGRLVAFATEADALVAGDVNGLFDIVLHDASAGAYELVSVSSGGLQGNGDSFNADVTPDGRFVGFDSYANNLVPGPVFGRNTYLRDRTMGTTTRLSVSYDGTGVTGNSSWAKVSNDGRLVCFQSDATNLVPGDTGFHSDVFLRDVAQGTTTLISRGVGGAPANGDSNLPAISGDGTRVAFRSLAIDLVPGVTTPGQIYVYDVSAGTIAHASTGPSMGTRAAWYPTLSEDGNLVVFSTLSALVTGDVNGYEDVYLRDLAAGTTTLLSRSSSGVAGNEDSFLPSVSEDGQFVAFSTLASTLTVPTTVGSAALVRLDRTTGIVEPLGFTSCGLPVSNGFLGSPVISPDGSFVAFETSFPQMVPHDSNAQTDVFLVDPAGSPSTLPCTLCSATPTSIGCLPTVTAMGSASASLASGFVLIATSVDGSRPGLFAHGLVPHTTPWSGGASYQCIYLPKRLGLQSSGGTKNQCDGQLSADWNAAPHPWAVAGEVVHVQAWIRDPGASAGSHFSEGLSFLVGP